MPCECVLLAYLGIYGIWDGAACTLHYHVDEWRNRSWGFHDIERSRIQCDAAISSDDSRMNRCEYDSFRYYFVPAGRGTAHTLYLRPENTGFTIDDARHSVKGGPCSCTWPFARALPDDDQCTRTAAVQLGERAPIGTGQVAGYHVIRYRAVAESGITIELSLAPALNCEVMDEVETWPGTLGVPGAKWHYRVTSYKPGEPDRTLFRLPAGYTRE